MKKTIALLLALLMGMAFGCGKKPEDGPEGAAVPAESTQAAAETSAPEPYEQSGKSYRMGFRHDTYGALMFSCMAETDDTLYYLCGNILYFSDKAYKDWMPLCARPNCGHNSADCDACLNTICGIAVFDRYIYYVDVNSGKHNESIKKPVLCRMRFDGTQHEQVCPLPVPKVSFEPYSNDWMAVFTDKYLVVRYLARRDETMRSGESASYVLDLETLEHKELDGYNGEPPLYGKGELLYLLAQSEAGAALGVLDCEACTVEEIGVIEKGFNNTWLQGSYDFTDDEFDYVVWDIDEDMLRLYSMSLADGKNVLLAEQDALEAKWLSFDFENHWLFASYFPRAAVKASGASEPFGDDAPSRYEDYNREEWGFYVFDLSLERLDGFLYSELPEEGAVSVFAQSGGYIFGKRSNTVDNESLPEWYVDKADIGTGGLMWKRWE